MLTRRVTSSSSFSWRLFDPGLKLHNLKLVVLMLVLGRQSLGLEPGECKTVAVESTGM